MNISDMHRNFRFGLDKMDGLNYPNFLPEEIDLLLNQAQDRLVKQRYGKNNIKHTSFEEEQKRVEDLRELVRTVQGNMNAQGSKDNTVFNSKFVTLEDDHWFLIWEKAYIYCPTCTRIDNYININEFGSGATVTKTIVGKEVEVRPTTHLELEKTRKDAFKGPDSNKVLRLMFKDRVELIPGTDCTIVGYIYRYIKQPNRVSITTPTNCELSEHMHQEMVDEAIKIALEGIEAKRTQTYPIIDNQKE